MTQRGDASSGFGARTEQSAAAVPYGRSVGAAHLSGVHIRDVTAGYGGEPVLHKLSLEVPGGGLTAILGASGSGKTTLLRVIAGFLRPETGSVAIGERPVSAAGTWVPPERRRVGIVPQEGALFPHLDVLGNVMFGLGRGDRSRALEVLDWVGLADRADARPQELSGGQQQRVALARALAPGPDVILLDEPFSALDASLRGSVRAHVRDVLTATGTTAVLVTHDQDEALSMADRVAIMARGTVEQVGTPREIYERPSSLMVARFVGAAVEFPGRVDTSGQLTCPLGTWPAPATAPGVGTVVVRPEDIGLLPAPDVRNTEGTGRVTSAEYYGHDTVLGVSLADGRPVTVRVGGPSDYAVGDPVTVTVQRTPLWFPDAV